MGGPGRSCPIGYRYRPEDLAGPAAFGCRCLFVVGGLYGNVAALHALQERAEREPVLPEVVFNGDFHYLDVDPGAFAAIAAGVSAHRASLGNVEYALAADQAGEVGCGCDYPDYVDDAVVTCSNATVTRLQETAHDFPEHRAWLGGLPRCLTVQVGEQRVGIVHGDPESLAGWGLALEAMEPADEQVRGRTGFTGTSTTTGRVADWLRRACVDVMACTHTGMAYAQDLLVDDRPRLVINNGSAGTGNFDDGAYGVLTRISTDPVPPADSLYGQLVGGLRCDAIPIRYDLARAVAGFERSWPSGTSQYAHYFPRLTRGTPLRRGQGDRLA